MPELLEENRNCFNKQGLLKVIHVTHTSWCLSHISDARTLFKIAGKV